MDRQNARDKDLSMGASSCTFSSTGIAMFAMFAALKLTGQIAWSWWWVTAPLWIPAALCLAIGAAAVLILGCIAAWQVWKLER